MPRFPSIPRLSIIVPVGSDLATFEDSLVSVLENRPEGCEVLVTHDGSYDDPFDLGDEVRLVTAGSGRLVELIAEGAAAARGRFVHVLAEGVCATEGWTELALEKFEHHDAAAVAPVIRHESGSIVAAGWSDTPGRLAVAAGAGDARVTRRVAAGIEGAYLQASFWRREVLRSLGSAFRGGDSIEAAYAYGRLIRTAGWRCVLADRCDVRYHRERLHWDTSSIRRGRRLGALRHVVSGNERPSAWAAGAQAVLSNLIAPSRWGEALGQMSCASVVSEMDRRVRSEEVLRCESDHGRVLRLPVERPSERRRAA